MEPQLAVNTFDDDREDDARRVVLVHGAMDRGASFSRVVGYLHDWVVTTYDRRGYAHSMGVPTAETLDVHVDDLIGILEGHQSTVIGHSLGGVITLTAAARRPELFTSVGVYESPMPWLEWWPNASAGSKALVDADDPSKSVETFMRMLVGDMAWEMLPMKTQEQRRAEGPALLADLRALRMDNQAPFDAATMTVPVAVSGGSESRPHHKEGCEEMAKLFHTDVQWIDGAEHGGHMSHPGPFASFVRRTADMRA